MNRSIVSQIKHAIERGLEEKVRNLIKVHSKYLSKQNIKSLLLYMRRHNAYSYSIIEYIFLLSPYRYDFTSNMDIDILSRAIRSSNVETAYLLLLDERFCKKEDTASTKLLKYKEYPVAGGAYYTDLFHELYCTCQSGNIQILRIFIDTDGGMGIDPNAHDGLALSTASEYGHIDMVRLLMADPRIDMKQYGSRILSSACTSNSVKIVQILLSDDRLDLSNYSPNIQYFCSSGYSGVIELLLKDGRLYSNFAKNAKIFISRAAQVGKIDTVQMLLRECPVLEEMDTRVIDSDDSDDSDDDESKLSEIRMNIENTIIRGHTEVVRLLLEDTRFHLLESKYDLYLHLACQYDRMEIVRLLINRTDFDPSYSNNRILLSVCKRSQRSVLRILLTDERIVKCGLIQAIRVADEMCDEEMRTMLECEQTKYESKRKDARQNKKIGRILRRPN